MGRVGPTEYLAQVIGDAIDNARREGYAKALDDYAIWKDGVQRIGCMDRDIKEIMVKYDLEVARARGP